MANVTFTEVTSFHLENYRELVSGGHAPTDPNRCAHQCNHHTYGHLTMQCGRKRGHGPEQAFCAMHTPDALAKREAKRLAVSTQYYIVPLLENGLPQMNHPTAYVDGPYDWWGKANDAIPAYKQVTKITGEVGIIAAKVKNNG